MSEAAILERSAWFLWISLGIASGSTAIPTNPVDVLPNPTPGVISVEKGRTATDDGVDDDANDDDANDDDDKAFLE